MEYFEDYGGALARLSRTKVGDPTGDNSWRRVKLICRAVLLI